MLRNKCDYYEINVTINVFAFVYKYMDCNKTQFNFQDNLSVAY